MLMMREQWFTIRTVKFQKPTVISWTKSLTKMQIKTKIQFFIQFFYLINNILWKIKRVIVDRWKQGPFFYASQKCYVNIKLVFNILKLVQSRYTYYESGLAFGVVVICLKRENFIWEALIIDFSFVFWILLFSTGIHGCILSLWGAERNIFWTTCQECHSVVTVCSLEWWKVGL